MCSEIPSRKSTIRSPGNRIPRHSNFGEKAEPAFPSSTPGCASSTKRDLCTTACAWSWRPFSPRTFTSIGDGANATSPNDWSTMTPLSTTATGNGRRQPAVMPNLISAYSILGDNKKDSIQIANISKSGFPNYVRYHPAKSIAGKVSSESTTRPQSWTTKESP